MMAKLNFQQFLVSGVLIKKTLKNQDVYKMLCVIKNMYLIAKIFFFLQIVYSYRGHMWLIYH